MRLLSFTGAFLAALAISTLSSGKEDEKEWKTAAKKVIETTAGHLEKKVGSDKEVTDGIKHLTGELMKSEELDRVVKDLKKKTGSVQADPDKLKLVELDILKQLEKTDTGKLKKALIDKNMKSEFLPCPPFSGCPDR